MVSPDVVGIGSEYFAVYFCVYIYVFILERYKLCNLFIKSNNHDTRIYDTLYYVDDRL